MDEDFDNECDDKQYESDDDISKRKYNFNTIPLINGIEKELPVEIIEQPMKKIKETPIFVKVDPTKFHKQRDCIIGSPIKKLNCHYRWRFTRINKSNILLPSIVEFLEYVYINPLLEYTMEVEWEYKNNNGIAYVLGITNIQRIAWSVDLFRKMCTTLKIQGIYTVDYKEFIEKYKDKLIEKYDIRIHFDKYKTLFDLCDNNWNVFNMNVHIQPLMYFPCKINTAYITDQKKNYYNCYYRIVDELSKNKSSQSISFYNIIENANFNSSGIVYLEENNIINIIDHGVISLKWLDAQMESFKKISFIDTFDVDFLSDKLNEAFSKSHVVATNVFTDREHFMICPYPISDKIWIIDDGHYKTISWILSELEKYDYPAIRGILIVGQKDIIDVKSYFYRQEIPLLHYDYIPYILSEIVKIQKTDELTLNNRSKYMHAFEILKTDCSIYSFSYKKEVIKKIIDKAPKSRDILFVSVFPQEVFALNKYVHSLNRDKNLNGLSHHKKNSVNQSDSIRRHDFVRDDNYRVYLIKKINDHDVTLLDHEKKTELDVKNIEMYTQLDCIHSDELSRLNYTPTIIVLFTSPEFGDKIIKQCFMKAQNMLIVSGVLQL